METKQVLHYAQLAEFAYAKNLPQYKGFQTYWKHIDNHEAVIINFDDELIISVRGTEPDSLKDWITNLMFLSFNVSKDKIKIHSGFNEGAEKLYKLLDPFILEIGIKQHKPITFIGHSAGGAKARVLGYLFGLIPWKDVPLKIITFGCPKTGNSAFNDALNDFADVYDFTHSNDVVHYVPLFHGTHKGFDELRICEKGIKVNPNFFTRLWGRTLALTRLKGVGIINHLIGGYITDLRKLMENQL